MSKFTDRLRAVKVYNPHDFYRDKGRVWIAYSPMQGGRWYSPAQWVVTGVGIEVCPDAPWYNHGKKCISISDVAISAGTLKERRQRGLEQAMAWAEEHFGITEWARDPYGGYGEASFVRPRTKELREAVKDQEATDA